MDEYKAVYDIKYHIIWVTKDRYKVFHGPIEIRALHLLRQECEARGISFLQGAVGEDHIHFLLSCPPSLAPSRLLQHLKVRSSRLLQDEFPELKNTYSGQDLWEKGYYCTTVGAMTEKTIRSYITNLQ